jgi:hypothetical protein
LKCILPKTKGESIKRVVQIIIAKNISGRGLGLEAFGGFHQLSQKAKYANKVAYNIFGLKK